MRANVTDGSLMIDSDAFFRNVRACAGGSDYAEQRLTNTSSPVMRWIPTHVRELGDNSVLMEKNVVVSVFQLLVRGYDYDDIAERMHVTYKFVRAVEQAAMMVEVKVNPHSVEAPDIFTENEYGRMMTAMEYERRVYRYWNRVLDDVLAVPADVEDGTEKGISMVKAWLGMTNVYIYIPARGLYYAGRAPVGQDGPCWANDIDDACGFKTMARARKIIDNLRRYNPVSMKGAQIVNEMGEVVTA